MNVPTQYNSPTISRKSEHAEGDVTMWEVRMPRDTELGTGQFSYAAYLAADGFEGPTWDQLTPNERRRWACVERSWLDLAALDGLLATRGRRVDLAELLKR